MDEVSSDGQELIITKNHKPVAKLVPFRNRPKTLFGIDKGKIKIKGDIVSPIDVDWNADKGKGWDNLL